MLSEAVTVVSPAAEPVALADAKRFLRVDGDSLDLDVGMLVGAAGLEIEQMTGQRMVEQTVEVRADCFADLSHLEVAPVKRVAEIRYLDPAGVSQVLSPASYDLVGAGTLEGGIVRAIGAALPPIMARKGAIVVRLVVGYEVGKLPPSLRWAVLALTRGKFEEKAVDLGPLLANQRVGA
ncbi:hypothetical protein [Sphingomonas sp. BK235]|uniref:head-tail connector protein n=1 Tax=Sphingomonas sp. BK235 TaxID=2512131 RepID=UPI00104FA920|nr:hypothetical protein [Sphingomonas sp. BK235]TCP33270.1 putative phiE125 gp8 family phage protein [Sphingomonas sp. BK235]